MIKLYTPTTTDSSPTRRTTLRAYLFSWELYLVVLAAGFIRFYQINTTEFDQDQSIIFRMAHDAILHGLLPTTSNTASIGIAHSAGVIYLYMLPALISPDPIGGAILVALFTTAAALLTYLFTRHYYGRFAGTVAALLYATATKPANYARFIWQPNLMPPFVVLFLFVLFWGVVERRKGWLIPALFLLGVLYQMHEIAILLAIPLVVAALLAPGTLRWRDLIYVLPLLVIIFFPYLLWELFTRFNDLHTILTLARRPAHIDGQALHFYWLFLIPYEQPPTDIHSALLPLLPLLSWLRIIMPLLTVLGFVTALVQLIAPNKRDDAGEAVVSASPNIRYGWWQSLRGNPYKCGLVVLLAWQIVPLLILSRHAIDLHAQYFFMFMPGPFILIGLFVSRVVQWLQRPERWSQVVRIDVYALTAILIAIQLLGSIGWAIDIGAGRFNSDAFYPYHNDLTALKHALSEAETLAQHQQLKRIYITTDEATQTALRYLSEQMQTPTTLFDASRCLVLPTPESGPTVFLVGPHDDFTNALLSQFTNATLVDQPPRLGGAPFRLYLVTSRLSQVTPIDSFGHDLQLLKGFTQNLRADNASWLITHWKLLQAESPRPRTTYNYVLTALGQSNTCTFTAIQAGDQLLVGFQQTGAASASTTVQAKSFTQIPYDPSYAGFHLETDTDQSTSWITLRSSRGNEQVNLQPGDL